MKERGLPDAYLDALIAKHKKAGEEARHKLRLIERQLERTDLSSADRKRLLHEQEKMNVFLNGCEEKIADLYARKKNKKPQPPAQGALRG